VWVKVALGGWGSGLEGGWLVGGLGDFYIIERFK